MQTTNAQSYVVPRLFRLFPAKKRVQMRYTFTTVGSTIDIPAAGLFVQNFNGNGLFDPDQTGAGNQPRGFDESMAIYSSYKVLGSSCTIRLQMVTPETGMYFGLYPQTLTAAIPAGRFPFVGITSAAAIANFGGAPQMLEMGGFKVATLGNPIEGNALVMSRSAKTTSVISTRHVDKASLVGDATKNPESAWIWSIFMGNDSATARNNFAALMVTIVYDVMLFERDVLVQS